MRGNGLTWEQHGQSKQQTELNTEGEENRGRKTEAFKKRGRYVLCGFLPSKM